MPAEHKIVKRYPRSKTCFGCSDNPQSVGAAVYMTEDGFVVGLVTTKDCHQGFPGMMHGGIILTYFDEVLWNLRELVTPDLTAVTLTASVTYKKPVPVGAAVKIIGKITDVRGRKFTAKGELILAGGQVAAAGEILYMSVSDEKIENINKRETGREREYFAEPDLASIVF
jgi:acyl-CoA thioesterase FadM